jgi:hypothetical protein
MEILYVQYFYGGIFLMMTPYLFSIINIHGIAPIKDSFIFGDFSLGEV